MTANVGDPEFANDSKSLNGASFAVSSQEKIAALPDFRGMIETITWDISTALSARS
ncbi:hypothetical protein RS3R6_34470 [Pseudomonas atacamensis]|uniref:Uncharacterized protein n=1 Tax=Pseudomonas atacamensis TaxID=2565368 RepID=A0ABQ5PIH5_9PSED|nr:hypothetical protein RS3R1_23180 [Pseudomonas atacamensis]GLH55265.1 hypothetical protein RS3R6_34470 [Pseudomonas atacamensis]